MKTTIDIPVPLFKKAKQYAERQHITFKAVIELGLQYVLIQHRHLSSSTFTLKKRSVSGNGLQVGLDWGNWGSIRSMSYEGRGEISQ